MGGGMVVDSLGASATNDNITTRNISKPTSHGHYNPNSNIFTVGVGIVTLGTSNNLTAGLVFDVYDVNASNQVTSVYGIEAITMTITFKRNVQFGGSAGVISFYIVPQADPTPYDDTSANHPMARITGTGSTSPQFLGSHTYTGADTARKTVTLGAIATGETTSNLFRVIVGSLFYGKMNISIDWSNTALAQLFDSAANGFIQLNIQTWPGHTGWVDAPNRKRTRAVHDYTMGYPTLSDEFVRDGFLEGIMVHRDSWDPKDPEPTYVINPLEGVVDDEIVDLE